MCVCLSVRPSSYFHLPTYQIEFYIGSYVGVVWKCCPLDLPYSSHDDHFALGFLIGSSHKLYVHYVKTDQTKLRKFSLISFSVVVNISRDFIYFFAQFCCIELP
jgi:hypothetical protein